MGQSFFFLDARCYLTFLTDILQGRYPPGYFPKELFNGVIQGERFTFPRKVNFEGFRVLPTRHVVNRVVGNRGTMHKC